MLSYFDFTGQVALVTGASSGLGAEAAGAYAEAGAKVALCARRLEKLEELARSLRETGAEVLVQYLDVQQEESVAVAVEAVLEKWGRIDILLNNAGVSLGGAADKLSLSAWEKSFRVNSTGPFLVSKYVLPSMMAHGYGRIVNTCSIAVRMGDKDSPFEKHAYNASKSALAGLTLAMASTYGQYGITVNAVAPGLFHSEMTDKSLFRLPEYVEAFCERNPMGRVGERGELCGPILFLSSPGCSYVTGQLLCVDGGQTLV